MPLRRSPPPHSSLKAPPLESQHAGSEPNIPTCRDDSDSAYLPTKVCTRGNKRKYNQDMREELQVFKEEIMDLLNAWKESQETKLERMITTITELRSDYQDLHTSVKFISEKYDDISTKITELEKQKQEQSILIRELGNKLESIEKLQKCSSIEIRNIPKMQKKETIDDLLNVVQNIGNALSVDLDRREIKDIFRLNTKSEINKPIIVDFCNKITKDKLITAAKTFNKKNVNNKLNTTHLKINDDRTPIYVSETLTTRTRKLFYLSRQFAKEHKYTFCWVSYGNIYLRKEEGAKQIRIDSESDIQKLKDL
ncbi:hypothetical protein RR48_11605 [Papilio machaon]|uniref:FP protein C-terminal domain-containing protein n=1 Tax=Papilio machaon TaxID=76193 RepID=A0A194R4A1_PAPMA|nr:hypothetical protein RR48_11605 [Papilio machaon]